MYRKYWMRADRFGSKMAACPGEGRSSLCASSQTPSARLAMLVVSSRTLSRLGKAETSRWRSPSGKFFVGCEDLHQSPPRRS